MNKISPSLEHQQKLNRNQSRSILMLAASILCVALACVVLSLKQSALKKQVQEMGQFKEMQEIQKLKQAIEQLVK